MYYGYIKETFKKIEIIDIEEDKTSLKVLDKDNKTYYFDIFKALNNRFIIDFLYYRKNKKLSDEEFIKSSYYYKEIEDEHHVHFYYKEYKEEINNYFIEVYSEEIINTYDDIKAGGDYI